jgi:hypothetical protein
VRARLPSLLPVRDVIGGVVPRRLLVCDERNMVGR